MMGSFALHNMDYYNAINKENYASINIDKNTIRRIKERKGKSPLELLSGDDH